jgi:hypothetical protein
MNLQNTTTTTVQDLRNQIAEIESKQVILQSERDELGYVAVVERAPAAIKRAAEIGAELAQLAHDEAMLNAALKTAVQRETEAKVAEQTKQKREDIEQAVQLLQEAERLALKADQAMQVLHESTAAFDKLWAKIRSLSGVGPQQTAVNVHLGRSFRTGLRGLPGVNVDLVPPNERHTVSELNTGWSRQVRNIAEPVQAASKARVKEFLR